MQNDFLQKRPFKHINFTKIKKIIHVPVFSYNGLLTLNHLKVIIILFKSLRNSKDVTKEILRRNCYWGNPNLWNFRNIQNTEK